MSVDQAEKAELACVYAGLLLHDAGVEITAEKISKLLSASGNKVDDYYPEFFAGFLKGCDFKSLLTAVPAAAPAAGAPAAAAEPEKKDDKKGGKDDKKKKEKEKPKEEEEEDVGMFDMFG